jgi:hypothetical protein
VYRVLKPGSIFMTYEWVTTPLFDAANRHHVACVDEIIIGNGLPVSEGGPRGHRCCVGPGWRNTGAAAAQRQAPG